MNTDSIALTPALSSMELSRTSLLWAGILSFVAGAVALSFPMLTSVSISLLLGAALLISGVSSLVSSFSVKRAFGFWPIFLSGLAALLLGLLVLLDPLSGLVALTLWIAAGLLANGMFEIYLGLRLRPEGSWLLVIVSGAVGILFSVLIASNLAASSVLLLGSLVGINYLLSGAVYLSLWYTVRRPAS